MTYADACESVATLIDSPARGEIVHAALKGARDLTSALGGLRQSMRSHVWKTGASTLRLDRLVEAFDRRTRDEGLHALHDWDGVADRVNPDIIPVDVLDYLAQARGPDPPDATSLAILVDYYLLHLLALMSLRAWDEGDPGENLDRLARLLDGLQEPQASGQRFVSDAETLLLVATSHYELNEHGYDLLLERVRTLGRTHRLRVALAHAASLGCHLRFGLEATYARDIGAMRDDNVADYPWLCFSMGELVEEYGRLRGEGADPEDPGRQRVVEALLGGCSADPTLFTGPLSRALASSDPDWRRASQGLARWRSDLTEDFDRWEPVPEVYSPLSFFFNFSHNVVKGSVVDALLWSEPRRVTLNDLLTSMPGDGADPPARTALATTLATYARANPHRIRGRLMPVIVYDPFAGRRAFAATMRGLSNV